MEKEALITIIIAAIVLVILIMIAGYFSGKEGSIFEAIRNIFRFGRG